MAEVPVTINGVLYPKGRSGTDAPVPCTIIGSAWITGLGVGGGPIVPPDQPPVGGPPGTPIFPIWGPPGIELPPGSGYPPVAGHPLPPIEAPPPDVTVPPPGSPPVLLLPVSPVNPIVAPAAIVVNYPGVGKVLVPNPIVPPAT